MNKDELELIQQDIFAGTDIPFIFTPENIQKFEKTFFEIIDLFSSRIYNYELLCKVKMLELINIIIEQFENKKTIDPSIYANNSVTAAKEYIDNNYTFNITLDSLAEQLYINKFTLMRNFKAKYGINIIKYYRKKRIDYAKKLLTETNYSVYTIGELLNFSDIYSFSRFFKSQTNMSPNSYRKTNK
jgi:AraC-like DNA-binding protein